MLSTVPRTLGDPAVRAARMALLDLPHHWRWGAVLRPA